MKFKITNLRAVELAETEDARITMIMGGNEAGKSAVMNGLTAALMGDPTIYGATNTNRKNVVRHKAGSASVLIQHAMGGECGISWPGRPITQLPLPTVSAVTCGLEDPADAGDKKAWVNFIRMICGGKAKITGRMLRERLEALPGQNKGLVDTVIKGVKSSYDGEYELCHQRALEARRTWTQATGQTFGTSKAEGWQADYYEEAMDEAKISADIDALNVLLGKADIIEKVGGASTKVLEKEITDCGRKMTELQHVITTQKTLVDLQTAELSKYPPCEPCPCPHCGEPVYALPNGAVIKRPDYGFGTPEHKALVKSLADENERLLTAKRDHQAFKEARLHAQGVLAMVNNVVDVDDTRSPEELRGALETARTCLQAVKTTKAASAAYDAFSFHSAAKELLSPTGLRLDVMQKALPELQQRIDDVSEYIFPKRRLTLEIDAKGIDLMFDGETYKSLTWNGDPNSYKLRVKYLFQIVQAQMLGDDTPVLLDRADTLEKRHLVGLLKLVKDRNLVAVIARTMDEKPAKDKLKAAGVGLSYWLENGKLEAV